MKPYPFDESQGDFSSYEKELTPEEVFSISDIEVPEHALIYIESLERRLRNKNDACKEAISILSDTSQSYAKSQISKILKL